MMPIYDKVKCSYCGKEFTGQEGPENAKPYNHDCKAWRDGGKPPIGGE